RQRNTEHRQQVEERLEHVTQALETQRQLHVDAEAQVNPLESARSETAEALTEAEARSEDATQSRQDTADAGSRWAARVEALQLALDAARARAGAEALADADGVLGTLLDLVR